MKNSSLYTFATRASVLSCALFIAACTTPQPTSDPYNTGTIVTNGTTTSSATPDGYYRVAPGDNLYRIGLRFNQSVATLSAWNNIANPTQISVGQLLKVRADAGSSVATASTTTNTHYTTTGTGSLLWPADGTVVSNFNGTTNKGIDIAGTAGSPIRAAAAGKVTYVGSGIRGYGNVILITHNNGLLTVYGHNDKLLVSRDQTVSAGQQIATMGNTDTTSTKLHFEVRVNGKSTNPNQYLSSR